MIELLISLAIFGFVILIALASFSMTSNLFSESLVRQSTENQLRAIKGHLTRDLTLSNSWAVNVIQRRTPTISRDALALPALNDWRDASNFRPDSGRPAWNRYVVWYANQEPKGRLVRQMVAPPLPAEGFFPGPYIDLGTNLSESDPGSNQDLEYSQTLTENLVDFEVNGAASSGTVTVRLRLLASGSRRAGGNATTVENIEVEMQFELKNTWPRI